MHKTSMDEMRAFFTRYSMRQPFGPITVLDVGALCVDGAPTYRTMLQEISRATDIQYQYTGLDIIYGHNVDVVAFDPYNFFPCPINFDVVISGQTLEHVKMPFAWIQAVARVMAPGGYACIIAPSEGKVHHTPDYWRIKPDAMRALFEFAGLQAVDIHLRGVRPWCDCVGIARKVQL